MSKESLQAQPCPQCGRRMYYTEQHLPVCDGKHRSPKPKAKKKGDAK